MILLKLITCQGLGNVLKDTACCYSRNYRWVVSHVNGVIGITPASFCIDCPLLLACLLEAVYIRFASIYPVTQALELSLPVCHGAQDNVYRPCRTCCSTDNIHILLCIADFCAGGNTSSQYHPLPQRDTSKRMAACHQDLSSWGHPSSPI